MLLLSKQFIKLAFCSLIISAFVFLTVSCPLKATPNPKQNTFKRFVLTETKLDLGDWEKFDFDYDVITNDKNRVLVTYRKTQKSDEKDFGRFFRISEDGGETFGKEFPYPKILDGDIEEYRYFFIFYEGGLATLIFDLNPNKDGYTNNMFYSRTDESFENWSEPARVNDVIGKISVKCKPIHIGKQYVFCSWTDYRSGTERAYFSASNDGGITWSVNSEIDADFRNASQGAPLIAMGENNRLHAVWTDKRDEKTLLDIRHSYSDDKGKTWSKSKKINDDEKPVWQLSQTLAVQNGVITVSFSDFREDGVENDRDWNIYYSRSLDNGETWEENRRLNDVKFGRQGASRMVKDTNGNLYSFWRTTQNTLFNQLAFSYSNDNGISWSPSVLLTDEEKMNGISFYPFPISVEKILIYWEEEEYGKKFKKTGFLTPTNEILTENDENSLKKVKIFEPLKYELGSKIFEDDFSADSTSKWTEIYGVWKIVDGTYRGLSPSEKKSFITTAKFAEPEKYVAKGRFKLDSAHHYTADFYIRMDDSNLRYYLIRNRFRRGSWLSIKDNDLARNLHESGGKFLEQTPFPYKSDVWYEWRLVVTPEQIDFYVDGRLMLSHKEKLKLKNNKFGIGGIEIAPTYFDDIEIYKIKE